MEEWIAAKQPEGGHARRGSVGGSHAAATFTAGWDQSLQKKTFTLQVKWPP
jgi:hypothetical protein